MVLSVRNGKSIKGSTTKGSCKPRLYKGVSIRMTETRFYEPARLSFPPKPLFLLKPLDVTTWGQFSKLIAIVLESENKSYTCKLHV